MSGEIEPQGVLMIIVYLALILAGVYYVTRLVAKGMGGRAKLRSFSKKRPIAIVDRVALDKDKSLTVIRYDGKEYLIGACAQSISVLESHEVRHDEAYPDTQGADASGGGYASNLFGFYLRKSRQKQAQGEDKEEGSANE